jgi:hypothetical protein
VTTQSIQISEHVSHVHAEDDETSTCTFCETVTRFWISGELADRVTSRLGVDPSTRVVIAETRWNTGYSSWTITGEWLSFAVECGEHVIDFATEVDVYESPNGLVLLLAWLDGGTS